MTEITIRKVQLSDGLVRFDLYSSGLPKNFLGLATDILFSGDVDGVGYKGMEWGVVFEDLGGAQFPINMVKYLPDEGRLVMGITLKANNLPALADGHLASFIFDKDIVPIGFENSVLSTFDGSRKDVVDVEWTVLGEIQSSDEVQQISSKVNANKAVGQQTRPLDLGDSNLVESNVFDHSIMDIISLPRKDYGGDGGNIESVLFFMGVLLCILLVFVILFRKKLRALSFNPARLFQSSKNNSNQLTGSVTGQIKLDY